MSEQTMLLIGTLVVCMVAGLVLMRRSIKRYPLPIGASISLFVMPVLVLTWRSMGGGSVLILLGMWVLVLIVLMSASMVLSRRMRRVPSPQPDT